jgi:hypothetical protein
MFLFLYFDFLKHEVFSFKRQTNSCFLADKVTEFTACNACLKSRMRSSEGMLLKSCVALLIFFCFIILEKLFFTILSKTLIKKAIDNKRFVQEAFPRTRFSAKKNSPDRADELIYFIGGANMIN